ncbi:DEAD/DEAH box helicase [Streptomyces pristinaespiralis]|uniref:Putative helicase n=1 Tax=Streptomyces pristinaespiralis TaxID=38300 RepID=A0A0M5IQ27_STRPR|nr:DEAD/DEAH box helicase [Streptomyces pristinaespiralis]ALC18541.1 putative helicase [Streptomyces pristinaespiralis]ALC25424.1 putative helicase [Streptomyces pristinaespiralis]
MVWLAPEQAGLLARCAVVFEAGDPARTGRLVFYNPDGSPLPETAAGEPGKASLVVPHDGGVALRTFPVLRLAPAEALPALIEARRRHGRDGATVHPAAAFWGAAAALGLHLAARERLLPGVSVGGYDTWRAGPLDLEDVVRLRELAQAAPGEAVAAPGSDVQALLRAFLDAVADTLPRTAAAPAATGRAAFSATEPQHVPQLRAWAEEISAGLDSGVRVSLHVHLADTPDGPPALHLVPRAHSLADPTLALDAGELFASADHALGPRAQADTILAVRRAASVWEPLERLLPVPSALVLTDRETTELIGTGAARLRAHGIDVHWPEGAARSLTARAVVGAGRVPPADLRSFLGGDGTVDLRWQLALDGKPLTEEETAHVADEGRPLVRLRGRWTLVGADLARKARERDLGPLTAIEALAVALTGHTRIGTEQVPVAPSDWLLALRARLADPDGGTEPCRQPDALAATLRDYQLRGLRWLERMTSLGLGGCLADDMGLGKTIQLIALHLLRQEHDDTRGPTLVVCPASLLGNWQREIGRFAPGTPVRRFHGTGRSLEGADDGFVLTTYGTMRLDAERLGDHRWSMLVADEAQHVKNPLSGTAKALRLIPADAKIALTGTPVENSLSELWAVLDWTTPGLLGSHGHFRRRWMAPIDAERADATGEQPTARRLAGLVRPFLLRRRKSDPGIAPELPPKTETDRPVALTAEQSALYRKHAQEVMDRIRASQGIARSGLVLKLLTGLKQICNHPAHFLKQDDTALSGRSGKLELLDELLDTITAEGGAVLVFTQYVAMAKLLERHLRERGIGAQLLHGGTPVPRREELVQRFQDGEVPVFLLSLKAAGTGLNLTRADHVVHYDRWWNPAVEAQATDRAYRIGQTRSVQVHKMIAEGTIEDRIAALLESKKDLADAVLGSGEGALTELTNDELANLVELRSVC